MSKYKLAILTSHVIQYQDPLFRQIAEHPEIDLTVLFCSREGAEQYHDEGMGVALKWDLELLKGYRHLFLRNLSPGLGNSLRQVNPGVVAVLRRERFDAVVVMGWNTATMWMTYLTCMALDIPFYIYGDNSFIPESRSLRARLREKVIRRLFAKAAGFLSVGSMNTQYYRYYGAAEEQIFLVPWAVDNERFIRDSQLSPAERMELRARHGIAPDRVAVVFPGKLIERKNPIHVLQAVERMKYREQIAVLFLGDGAERERLSEFAHSNGISGVHFLGFVNQTELPRMYGMADFMVLPSSFDPRGTVTNEAMACGLPVVISDMVGVYGPGDIVRDGENGFVYPLGDIDSLSRAFDRLVGDPELRTDMGRRSHEIISRWGYAEGVEGIWQALARQRGLPAAHGVRQ
jgi:glycosyltransferase involved in cell wall biosynthesis